MEEKEMFECSYCHELFEELDGNDLCDDCADNHTECYKCGALTHTNETNAVQLSDGRGTVELCDHCYENKTFECARCNDVCIGESTEIDGQEWCGYCVDTNASRCDNCGDLTESVEDVIVGDGYTESWCSCCMENTIYCESCGNRYSDNFDECPDCYESPGDGIHSYDYKPAPSFVGEGSRYFGVELEVESIGKDAFSIPRDDEYSNVYYKHDGSLSNGYEIVTHPHTLDAFYESYENKTGLFGVIDALQGKAKSHDVATCGMHIHITKPSRLTTAKVMSFVYSNHAMFEVLCRRKCNSYCSSKDIPEVDKTSRRLLTGGDRYGAMADRGNTIEFRLPKGTLKASTVIATIEIADAIVKYCESNPIMQLSAEGFLKFCGQYKYIRSYDMYTKLITEQVPDKCCPRRKVERNVKTSSIALDISDNAALIAHCVDSNTDVTAISEPDRSMDGQPTYQVYHYCMSLSPTPMTTQQAQVVIDTARELMTIQPFYSRLSAIDAMLMSIVDMFVSEHASSIEHVASGVVIGSLANRVRELFNIQRN